MTRLLTALVCLVFLAGCGGGGGGGPVIEPEPVISMSTDVMGGLSPTYRAVFDCTARVTVNGITANVTGTYTLETLPGVVTSPINGLDGQMVKNRIQLSALGQSFDIEIREFVYVDGAGRWWGLGGEDTEGTRSWWSGTPPATYPPPVDETVTGRILNYDNRMAVGQRIDVAAIDALLDSNLTQVLFTRAGWRQTTGTEVVDTALGRYDTYRSNAQETIDLNDGNGPVTVDFIRWERPDLGLVALHAEGLEVQYDTYDVTVHSMDCVLRTHTP